MTTTLARLTAALLVVSLTLACATTKEKVDDPTYVQTLRIKITKVRNAVEETRNTIALSRGAPYLPELYVRLAELLSEEARYHYRLAYEREQRSSRVLHVPQVRVLKEEAITIYNSILQRFPKTPLAARVLFNIGHEHRELGNFDDMRKTLDKLVDNYPDSPLRSDALLVLGDYHFDRTELTQAERYYALLIKSPLNRVTGLGHYKQAWVWVNQGKCKRALVDFEKAIVRSKAWEELEAEQAARAADLRSATEEFVGAAGVTQQAIDVRRESLVDMAYCYSRERPVKGAVAYFRRMAYNRGTYLAALDKLASRYRLIDNAEGAIGTTRELLRLGSASLERLDDARTLYTAVKRAKRYSKLDLDVKLICQTYTRHSSRLAITDDTRQRLEEEFEAYIRDLATDAQERIPKLKKGGDKAKIARARVVANAYQTYAETFPNSPELANMLLNQTEMLTKAGDHLAAGLAAARASDLLGDGPERQTALYDAVVAFQTSLDQPVDRRRYERVTARAALRRTARELLRFPLEPDRDRRVKFAIAQTYFDEGNHRAAIDQLSAVAYAFPNTKEGDASIELILDSYTTTNDTDGLIAAGRRFVAAESPASDGLKGRIGPFIAAAEQTKLDELSLAAAGEEGGGLEVLENFAQQNQGSELGERAILNAFVVARAQGNTQKMQELAGTIANTYPKSDQLPGIYASMAQTAVARFAYDQAVAA
ncbi:MAG: tetratricopeptide repeat protein [Myxococcota bacterium]